MNYMFNEYTRLLNSTEILRNNINVFIDAFVEYYGEDKRNEIEEKFQKALYITYKSPDSIKNIIYQLKQTKSDQLSFELSAVCAEMESIYTTDILLNGYSYDSPHLMPITAIEEFYRLFNLGKEQRKEEFINKGLSQIQDNIPEFTKEDLQYVFDNKIIPDKYSNIPIWVQNNIYYYSNVSNAEKEYQEQYSKIEHILKKANQNITLDTFGKYLINDEIKNLLNIIERFRKQLEEYKEYESTIKDYIEEARKNEELYHKLSNKYYKMYIKENIDLIPEDKRENLDKFLNNENEDYFNNSFISNLFGYSVKGISIINSFSEEADQILEENDSFWKIQQVKDNRIKYFNLLGININGEYEDYLNNPDVQKLWPSKDRIEELLNSKDKYTNMFNIEYYESLPTHKKMREEIDSLNLEDKDDMFDASIYEKKGTFVTPNMIKTESGYELFTLVGIYCGNQDNYLDASIVHELNHLYEMTLLDANEEEYKTSCGWEILTGKVSNNKKEVDTINIDREMRSYELFNEIINELIAQDISEIMKKNNKHVFNSEYTAKIKGGTAYESSLFIVKDFFEEYKEKIIESRNSGNIEIIWNEVGKENFDELNNLFHIFNDNFSGFGIYNVRDALRQNIDNEQTRIYKSIIFKRDEILEKMKNYKTLNNVDTKKM